MKYAVFVAVGCAISQFSALSEDFPVQRVEPLSAVPNLTGSRDEQLARLEIEVRNDRVYAPEIVANVLNTDSGKSTSYVCEVVQAAIRGLGKSISKVEIARLIKAAVETRPAMALEIVCIAVKETRPQLHPEIVAAAVSSVPDPYFQVGIRYLQEAPFSNSACDMCALGYEPSDSPGSRTLAEAILGAAIGAGSTAGLDSLLASVNYVLFNPGQFIDTDIIPLPTPSPVSP
jgi:hypothetical protein